MSMDASESLERYERERNANLENLTVDARGDIIAGTDTTAVTATYAIWLLANHLQIEYELAQAVSALSEDFIDEDLREIKLPNNVVQETLRFRGAVGSALPRLVPVGGAEFCTYFVSEGTTVGLQARTIHRKREVWVRPEQFEPSRWNEPTQSMKDCSVAFSGGSRICTGMHLAQLELRHALATYYRTFDAGVKPAPAEGFSEKDMRPASHFLIQPRGQWCLVTPKKSMG
ncbi:hypothetical protein LTR37_016704 [Vermiconidia calcicola]|uniref:Uncharacterized protein n=1 Tax=Vermiconidia calcicola TaxID=1690605 RepID=A0ACC3MNJ6_9PEZI|nr:hypothetical protein LTR37_016704 [Vermiconidia calcicola]